MHRFQKPIWFIKVKSRRHELTDNNNRWIMWEEKGQVWVSPIKQERIHNLKHVIIKGESAGVKLRCGKKKQAAMQEWLLPYEI